MEKYDVVIIGSGLGGLLSAVILAKEGMKVCILEKDKQIGGCLQTFSLHKTVFDSCVHYIGGLGDGHTLNQIFRYAGIMDKLNLKPFDPNGFDRIAFANENISYPHAIGFQNFIEQLLPFFPKEKQALTNYINTITKVGDHFPLYRLRLGTADEKNAVAHWKLTDTLQAITQNPLLQNVLAGNNLLYAGEKETTPFYLHALVLESYMHSAHKVIPGSSQIAKLLWKELQTHGGTIHRNTEVTQLVEQNGTLQYAQTQNGERYYANQFIANIHPQALLHILQTTAIRPAYKNRINALAQTTPAFMLNLVLRPQTIPIPRHNTYWHRFPHAWGAQYYNLDTWPANYALYYTESALYPGYAESLSALTYMQYREVAQWAHTTNHAANRQQRGNDYELFKDHRSHILLETIIDHYPHLRAAVVAQSAATPLTFRDYTGTPQGALYGILKDVNKPAETQIATRTKIPNLLLTGQNVNLHGVLGVSITAIATCAELLGMERLLTKVKQA